MSADTAPAPASFAPPQPGRTPAGVLLLRLLGLVGLLTLVGAGSGNLVIGFFAQDSRQTRTLDGTVTTLDVDTAVADVTVRYGPAGSPATVTTDRRWSFVEPTSTTEISGGTLRLRGACGGWSSAWSHCSVAFTVTVPADAEVVVATTTGDIRIDGAAADVEARTVAGDIRMTGLRSGVTRAQSTVGDVSLQFSTAPDAVSVRTTTGDVSVLVPDDGTRYRVVANPHVGDRTVDVLQDPSSSHRIDAETSVGDIVVATGAAASGG
jgi:hypothetical protein